MLKGGLSSIDLPISPLWNSSNQCKPNKRMDWKEGRFSLSLSLSTNPLREEGRKEGRERKRGRRKNCV